MWSLWHSGASHQSQPEGGFEWPVQKACAEDLIRSETSQNTPWSKARHEAEVGWACLGVREAPTCLGQGHVPERVSGMKVNFLMKEGVNGTLTQGWPELLLVSWE